MGGAAEHWELEVRKQCLSCVLVEGSRNGSGFGWSGKCRMLIDRWRRQVIVDSQSVIALSLRHRF